FRGVQVQRPAEGFAATPRPGEGYLVDLHAPTALRSIVLDPPSFAVPPAPADGTYRLVVRPASPAGNGWTFGPPAFVVPPLAVGPLYDGAVPQATQATTADSKLLVSFPSPQASAWLLHWASGDDVAKLAFREATTTVRSVTIEPAPSGLELALRAEGGEPEVVLWRYPSPLRPQAGPQPVVFTPIAAKRLNARLAGAAGTPALSLPLRLHATTGGAIAVEDATIDAHFVVHALGPAPAPLALRGDWIDLTLSAPAGLRPDRGTLSVTAHHLGRELNGPLAPPAGPGGPGLWVRGDRWVAARTTISPATDPTAPVMLAAAGVDLAAGPDDAEVVVELRADVQDGPRGPGTPLGAPAVARVAAGARSWVEVTLTAMAPAGLPPGSRIWVVLRTNRGAVRWFADDEPPQSGAPGDGLGEPTRTSSDGGRTWSGPDIRLRGAVVPRLRLFHAVEHPAPPVLQVRAGSTPLPAVTLSGTGPDPFEFGVAAAGAPPVLLDLLGRTPGTGKVPTRVTVASTAVMDLTLDELTLHYRPDARPTGG
ncbi:MAG: hypothetical protein QOI56_1300, partial [Actinomycetota bacterium]|nr:hypothetical protein [Actinomycetota bacterium]